MGKNSPARMLDDLEEIIDNLGMQLEEAEGRSKRLLAEFSSFRRRAEIDKEAAAASGSDLVVVELAQLVDDCDRALGALPEDCDPVIRGGLEQLRKSTIDRFAALGYLPVAKPGDDFDPLKHEALSLEYSDGPENKVVNVFRLGWRRADGPVIVPASVSVSRNDYVCPFGIQGCVGDCAGCEEAGR